MSIPDNIQFGALHRDVGRFSTMCGDGDIPTALDKGIEIIPRDKLPDKGGIPRRHIKHIFGQLDGMCTTNGTAGILQIGRSQQGLSDILLSPEEAYRYFARWGDGSTLPDNIDHAMRVGFMTRQSAPQEWPVRVTHDPAEARQYRIREAIDLDGLFDAVLTCLNLDWPCLIGVTWPGRRGGGHSVACTEFTKGRRERDDTLGGPNSWGKEWNGDGFYKLTRRECDDMPYYGAFAIRVVSEADDDPIPPGVR